MKHAFGYRNQTMPVAVVLLKDILPFHQSLVICSKANWPKKYTYRLYSYMQLCNLLLPLSSLLYIVSMHLYI